MIRYFLLVDHYITVYLMIKFLIPTCKTCLTDMIIFLVQRMMTQYGCCLVRNTFKYIRPFWKASPNSTIMLDIIKPPHVIFDIHRLHNIHNIIWIHTIINGKMWIQWTSMWMLSLYWTDICHFYRNKKRW